MKEGRKMKEPRLINLKPGDQFLIPESSNRYTVLVRYEWDRITTRNETTKKTVVFSGNLKVIPYLDKT